MTAPGGLLGVALLLLQVGFPGAASDTVTLKEGENLNLHCNFSTLSDNNYTLQWLNPHNFTIFFNTQRVLRDQRYKLLRYSKDELSIQLSNVTVRDDGVYTCFYYSRDIQRQSRNVEILAAPSQPVLEVSQDAGRGIRVSCYTRGSRPQPRISWLLDNGIELPGDTKHQLGADGKKWSTSSTLRVLSYSPEVTASCIIQHPALRGEKLLASFHFQDLHSTGSKQPTRLSEDAEVPSPSENPAVSSPSEDPAVTSPSVTPKVPAVPSPSAAPKVPAVPSPSVTHKVPAVPSPSAAPEDPAVPSPSAAPEVPAVPSPSAAPEDSAVPSSAPTPAQPALTDVTSGGPEVTPTAEELGGSSSSGGFSGPETAPGGNVTEEEAPGTEVPPPRENVTVMSTLTLEQNPEFKGIIKKEKNLLLPILVAALIFVLLVIVLLFVVKLKKAHGVWKRENDVSEQTLESYKSRSNEDSPGHEKNGQAVNAKPNTQYVTEGYLGTPEKNPETPEKNPGTLEKNPETPEKNPGDKNFAISEKMFRCGRETDV